MPPLSGSIHPHGLLWDSPGVLPRKPSNVVNFRTIFPEVPITLRSALDISTRSWHAEAPLALLGR